MIEFSWTQGERVSLQGCVSLRKSNTGFLNPKESENGSFVFLYYHDKFILDLSDLGASNAKEPNYPFIFFLVYNFTTA